MNKHFWVTVLTATLLTACGGGGGGGDAPQNTPSVLTGSFVDSPVKGLHFETPTRSGLTNVQGEFQYLDGEMVTFSVGGTQLGIAQGADTLTPFSLLGIGPLISEVEITASLTSPGINSFDRALNVATLLQTLDIDGNPDNDIDLGKSHAQLKDHSISLSVKARDFENQADLDAAKTLTGTSNSRTLGDAAKHLYNSLGIDIESNLTSRFVSTQNNKPLNSVEFEYNSEGKITSEGTDTDNDGTIDITKTFTYGQNGNLLGTSNSASSTSETLNYDSNNNLLSRLIVHSQGQDLQSYFYVNNQLSRFELDQSADGVVESTTFYTYDSQGNLSGYNIDKDGDGAIDTVATYTYINGLVESFTEDSDNNGTLNFILLYTYDVNDNRTEFSVKNNLNGDPLALSTFEYDGNNNVIHFEQDRDLDGIADHIETYGYDENHNRTLYRKDLNADGVWNIVTEYRYDINGNRTRMIEDNDGNGIVDKIWIGSYQPAIFENGWDLILGKL